jgi:hypothetical protein
LDFRTNLSASLRVIVEMSLTSFAQCVQKRNWSFPTISFQSCVHGSLTLIASKNFFFDIDLSSLPKQERAPRANLAEIRQIIYGFVPKNRNDDRLNS